MIIGVGQAVRRDEGAEARALILESARAAGDDSASNALRAVSAVEMMRVGSWRDDDVPGRVAEELGLSVARERLRTSPTGGESPLRALDAVATRIAAGESGVTLIAGAEANGPGTNGPGAEGARGRRGRWEMPAQPRRGFRMPREFNGMSRAFQVGIVRALDFFPLYENALRASEGASLAVGQAESARMWAELSRVAVGNPFAWSRDAVSEDTLLDVGPSNRMVAFPYSKLLTANPFVNQGAAILVADDDTARSLGVPEDRWVHVVGAAGADEPADSRARVAYQRNPALELAVDRVRALTDTTSDDYDHVELYSCFPSMPKLSARVLGPLRPASVSVTGGLTFFGGPGSNYMTHGLASMVDLLRANGGTGFLHGVGMFMTKHHAVVLADRPRNGGFVTGGDIPTLPGVDVVDDYEGRGTIETYTVMYARDGSVERGVVIGRGAGGERFAARVDAADTTTTSTLVSGEVEPVGLAGTVRRGDDVSQFHL